MSWLTPDMVERAYDLNRAALPFRRMRLPDPDEICLRVSGHRDRYGHFQPKSGRKGFHEIAVSDQLVKTMPELMSLMAHEMIHLYQEIRGTASRCQHNAEFKRLARIAERRNGLKDVLE